MRYYYTSFSMAKIKKQTNNAKPLVARMRDNWNSHILLTEMQNGSAILKNYLAVSYTIKYIYSYTVNIYLIVFILYK